MAQIVKTDWILFLTIVVLVCFGAVMVYSASSVAYPLKHPAAKGPQLYVRHAVVALLALALMMALKLRNYTWLDSPVWALTGVGVTLLLLLLVYPLDPKAHRWIRLGGGLQFQPSELAKPALIVFLAWWLSKRESIINERESILPAALVTGLLGVGVVVADLGTAVVMMVTACVMFWVAGLDRRHFLRGGILLAIVLTIAVVAKPLRLGRLVAFFDPHYEIISLLDPNGYVRRYVESGPQPQDQRFQGSQSKIAVGTGGVLGVGLTQSRQKLLFLPEAHTDFIYAVIGEELGLWGTTSVLIGFLIIIWRGLRVVASTSDGFARYLALGVTVSIGTQALMNLSVALDMGPTKGIPLPLISYGGSSLMSSLACLGILASVSDHAS